MDLPVEWNSLNDSERLNFLLNDCCCAKNALKVSKLHNFVTIQDTDMCDPSF